jgi:hypothetical protein
MGRWNDLPFEIKCAILKEAVTQLAESWTDHSLPWGSHRPILFSFQQLCAFQLTCREFQQILTKRIKIQDLSPVKCFQRKQYETVSVIIMMAAWQAGPKVGFFYSMRKCLGAFWRNPLFLRDTNLVSHTFHGSFDCWVRNWLITQMKEFFDLNAIETPSYDAPTYNSTVKTILNGCVVEQPANFDGKDRYIRSHNILSTTLGRDNQSCLIAQVDPESFFHRDENTHLVEDEKPVASWHPVFFETTRAPSSTWWIVYYRPGHEGCFVLVNFAKLLLFDAEHCILWSFKIVDKILRTEDYDDADRLTDLGVYDDGEEDFEVYLHQGSDDDDLDDTPDDTDNFEL